MTSTLRSCGLLHVWMHALMALEATTNTMDPYVHTCTTNPMGQDPLTPTFWIQNGTQTYYIINLPSSGNNLFISSFHSHVKTTRFWKNFRLIICTNVLVSLKILPFLINDALYMEDILHILHIISVSHAERN